MLEILKNRQRVVDGGVRRGSGQVRHHANAASVVLERRVVKRKSVCHGVT
jgi:hypothetical protein